MFDRNADQIIVEKNTDLDVVKKQYLCQKMRILNISRLNILFTKRRHSTSECLSAFPMENITSTHLVLVHNKEMHLRKSYKRSGMLIRPLFYSISIKIKVATGLKTEYNLTLRLSNKSEHSDAHFSCSITGR